MQNLLAKLVALGIIAGGFALTGDLGWLAERGQRVIGAAEVASAPAMAFGDSRATASSSPTATELAALAAEQAAALPVVAPAAQQPSSPAASQPNFTPIDKAGQGRLASQAGSVAVSEFRPPVGGPQRVSLAGLPAGARVVVWLASTRHRCLVFDMVDPATGAALVYEAAAVTSQGQPLAAAGPPRRVVISGQHRGGSGGAEILRGGMLNLTEASLAAADRGGEWLGPVESMAVID